MLLLLWVKPGQRLWAEPASSSSCQYPWDYGQRNGPSPGGVHGQVERGCQPWGAAPKGGGTTQAPQLCWALYWPPALLLWHTGPSRGACVCRCPLQSTLGFSRPGTWCRTKAAVAHSPRSDIPNRACAWHWGRSWITAWLHPHGAESRRVCPTGSPGSMLGQQAIPVIPFGFLSYFLGTTSADGAKSPRPGQCSLLFWAQNGF